MRFIYTADLHLGKRLNDVPLIEDQMYILGEIRRIAREERAQAGIIAGDIYQSSSPQAEAMSAFNDFVTALAEDGTAVLAISGNHDSARRVSYLSALVRARACTSARSSRARCKKWSWRMKARPHRREPSAFRTAGSVRRCFPDEEIETCQDAVAAVLRHSPLDGGARNAGVPPVRHRGAGERLGGATPVGLNAWTGGFSTALTMWRWGTSTARSAWALTRCAMPGRR